MTVRILLVDDNRTFLASVKKSLGYVPEARVVGEAHDGEQALTLVAQLQPDLVLLDIVMPGLNGFEVARTLMSRPQPPRILFLSMHDNESYRAAAVKIGALGLVGKANFVAELMPVIADLAAHSAEASS